MAILTAQEARKEAESNKKAIEERRIEREWAELTLAIIDAVERGETSIKKAHALKPQNLDRLRSLGYEVRIDGAYYATVSW